MGSWSHAFLIIAATLACAGCQSLLYSNLDAPIGSLIVQGDVGSANTRFRRTLVVAPPGTRSCHIANIPMFGYSGPQARARPDENGEMVLGIWTYLEVAVIECATRDGPMRREITPLEMELERGPLQVWTPIVHMAGPDALSETRWTNVRRDLCAANVHSAICDDARYAALKAHDLGSAP
jgi:hypothetical protein